MKQSTKEKLIAHSNAIYHKLMKEDENGFGELTTLGIVVSFVGVITIYLVADLMLGGF